MQPRAILAVSLVSITIVMVMLAPSTSIIMVDAKPEKKFCNNFANTDGSTSEVCGAQSMGGCKNNERDHGHEEVGGECHKEGKEPTQGSENTHQSSQGKGKGHGGTACIDNPDHPSCQVKRGGGFDFGFEEEEE